MKRMIIIGLVLGALGSSVLALENEGIYTWRVGQLEVSMLVESERDGNTGILVGADEAVLRRLIPETGFKHTANAFLIRSPRQTILIDTGTGAGGILIEKIKKLGVDPDRIDVVLITHLHGDHFGGLQSNGNANFSRARIYLSSRELEYFTKTNVNQGAVAALAPYEGRINTFEPGALGSHLREILPGIKPIANYGHTPGHTVFLVENGNGKVIIAADFLHLALVQFPFPDISATFDIDKEAAAVSRRQILDYAAKNKIPIGGMHIVYPGVGTVEAEGNGYKFIPMK
jgi:glyoxylase-like metal-dependent hydrolase (beta-lactamase superfamily II)